ncbi:hypothetical protein M405DRAFT_869535, partial [Rhizopogon salebrosus TDB-379]
MAWTKTDRVELVFWDEDVLKPFLMQLVVCHEAEPVVMWSELWLSAVDLQDQSFETIVEPS